MSELIKRCKPLGLIPKKTKWTPRLKRETTVTSFSLMKILIRLLELTPFKKMTPNLESKEKVSSTRLSL